MFGRVASLGAIFGLIMIGGVDSAASEKRQTITVEAGHSSIVTIPLDVLTVSSADPKIVDAQMVNNRQVLLNARSVGATDLVVWDPQNRPNFLRVVVTEGVASSVRTSGSGIDQSDPKTLRIQFHVGQSRLIDMDLNASRVVVTDPEMADVQVITPKQILINGKKPGLTTLIIWTAEGRSVFYDLEINLNTTIIQERISEIIRGSKISVEAARDGVILVGTVSNLEDMNQALTIGRAYTDNVTNLLRVGGAQQVQLEVKIAEVSRTALREAGINLFGKGGKWTVGTFSRGAGGADASVIPPGVASRSPFFDAFQLVVGVQNDLSSVISLLESEGLSKTLASPTLVARSGQEASFLVGGEFPIPVAQQSNTITIEFKEFGIRLRFIPTVIGEDLISMRVAPEVSDIDFTSAINLGGVSVPGLTSRRAETTVELRDGQSFAIAGLLSDRVVSTIDRVPFLGDIPVLGALFRSVKYRREETELIILVSPRLASPLEADRLPNMPGANRTYDPDNFHLFLLGTLDQDERRKLDEKAGLVGPSGLVGLIK